MGAPPLIGRSAELTQLQALLAVTRLVTVTGAPGVGKTAVATAVAAAWTGRAVVVDLAGVPDSALVASRVASTLGVAERIGQRATDAVAAAFSGGPDLLVLDNCENLVEGVAPLLDALRDSPSLHLLATSRRPLHVQGEVIVALAPLGDEDAIALFCDRDPSATAADAGAAIATLGGLPLAIILAAAPGGDHRADERDLTRIVGSAVDQLDSAAREVLALLTVNPAGLDQASVGSGDALEALVEAALVDVRVVGASVRFGVIEPVRDILASVLPPAALDRARSTRLGYCQQLAAELRAVEATAGEAKALAALDAAAANVAATLHWAITQAAAFDAGGELAANLVTWWLERGRFEEALTWIDAARRQRTPHADLLELAAGSIRYATGEVAAAARHYRAAARSSDERIAAGGYAGLAHVANVQARYDECEAAALRAMQLAQEDPRRAPALLSALDALASMADTLNQQERLAEIVQRELRLARDTGNVKFQARAALRRASAEWMAGRVDAARIGFTEAVDLARRHDARHHLARALTMLGSLIADHGDLDEGIAMVREGLELATAVGDAYTAMTAAHNLAVYSQKAGDLDESRRLLAFELELARAAGYRGMIAWALSGLGQLALIDEEPERAASLFGQSLTIMREVNEKVGLAIVFEWIASLADRRGNLTDAMVLVGVADELWDRAEVVRDPAAEELVAAMTTTAAATLGEPAVVSRRARGRALPPDQGELLAREVLARPPAAAPALAPADDAAPLDSGHPVTIRTLGAFAVVVDGETPPTKAWQSRKARDVLKILAARRGEPMARSALADAVWADEDVDESRLRSRLSVMLSTIRQVVDRPERASCLRTDRDSVALNLEIVDLDIERFFAAADDGDLATAEALYAGDFLPEDLYADWAGPIRESARVTYLTAARRLARAAATAADHDRAATLAARMLEHDQYDDEAHRLLISALVRSGRAGAAQHSHQIFMERMAELGVDAPALEFFGEISP